MEILWDRENDKKDCQKVSEGWLMVLYVKGVLIENGRMFLVGSKCDV